MSDKEKSLRCVSDRDEVPPVYLLSPCMRPRLGALSKSVFSGYLLIKKPQAPLDFRKNPNQNKTNKQKEKKLKHYSVSFLRSALGLISKPTLKLSSGSPLAASVGLSLLGMALCVGDCAVCESQPPSRGSAHCFQPPLGCTTTLLFNGSSSDFCVNTQI